jgi:hypothetical protein
VTVTLHLNSEIEAGLLAQADAAGVSPEAYLQQVVEREFGTASGDSEGSGMVWENGLFVYRTGRPVPVGVADDAVRDSREERSRQILGERP